MSDLRTEVQHLIQVGYNEAFADGMESEFSRQLVALIQTHGAEALPLIDAYLIQGYQGDSYNSEIASEALLWLGLMDHPATFTERRLMIERSLTSRSSRLRDSASNAISFLDDPASIPALQYAIAKEPVPELQADMQQVLGQLKRMVRERDTHRKTILSLRKEVDRLTQENIVLKARLWEHEAVESFEYTQKGRNT